MTKAERFLFADHLTQAQKERFDSEQSSVEEQLSNIRVIREQPASEPGDGIEFVKITEDDGKFFWNGAPNSPQNFYFGAPGFVEIRNRVLTPRDEDQIIVMAVPDTLKGTVSDATTGKPIPTFFVRLAQGTTTRVTRSDTSFAAGLCRSSVEDLWIFSLRVLRQNPPPPHVQLLMTLCLHAGAKDNGHPLDILFRSLPVLLRYVMTPVWLVIRRSYDVTADSQYILIPMLDESDKQ